MLRCPWQLLWGIAALKIELETYFRSSFLCSFILNWYKLLKNVPTANDIRYHLNKINNFEELEIQINQALKSRIPLGLKKGCLKVAIDLNLICYYGKPTLEELPYIYRILRICLF